MADTQRTRSALLTLFADNSTGQISSQDFRDFVVTVMNSEFANTGDFWAGPSPAYLTAEGVRGWCLYSQVCDDGASFGNVLYLTISNTWRRADAADSAKNAVLAIAASTITSANSGTLLFDGLVWNSLYSATFDSNTGRPIYLHSGTSGSIAMTAPTYAKTIGYVLSEGSGIYRFKADWSVVGV